MPSERPGLLARRGLQGEGRGRRAQRASSTDLLQVFERSERSERSEFCSTTSDRAPQCSRSEAETATACAPAGCRLPRRIPRAEFALQRCVPHLSATDMIAENIVHFALILRTAGMPIGPDRVLAAMAAIEIGRAHV